MWRTNVHIFPVLGKVWMAVTVATVPGADTTGESRVQSAPGPLLAVPPITWHACRSVAAGCPIAWHARCCTVAPFAQREPVHRLLNVNPRPLVLLRNPGLQPLGMLIPDSQLALYALGSSASVYASAGINGAGIDRIGFCQRNGDNHAISNM